jgi:hypothetical protein
MKVVNASGSGCAPHAIGGRLRRHWVQEGSHKLLARA